MSYNGKSICEVRAKMNEKFNFNRAEQIATKKIEQNNLVFTPHFANTMLAAGF